MKMDNIKFNNTYHYYNCNPQHRLTDDCVIRAICSSTGDSWEDTMRALVEWSIKIGYMLNTPECYGKYLGSIGYVKQKQLITMAQKCDSKSFVKSIMVTQYVIAVKVMSPMLRTTAFGIYGILKMKLSVCIGSIPPSSIWH